MKTMGLSDLRLVAPEKFPAPEARWMATSAIDVLDRAKIHGGLTEAISDCVALAADSTVLGVGQIAAGPFLPSQHLA